MEIDNSSTFQSSDVHGTQNCRTKILAMLHHENIKTHRTLPGPTDPMLSKHTNRMERHQAHNFEASKGHQDRTKTQGDRPGTQIRNRPSRSCIKNRLGETPKTAHDVATGLAHTFEIDVHARPFFTCNSAAKKRRPKGGFDPPGGPLIDTIRTHKRKRFWDKS